jgi:hypothetical protein
MLHIDSCPTYTVFYSDTAIEAFIAPNGSWIFAPCEDHEAILNIRSKFRIDQEPKEFKNHLYEFLVSVQSVVSADPAPLEDLMDRLGYL